MKKIIHHQAKKRNIRIRILGLLLACIAISLVSFVVGIVLTNTKKETIIIWGNPIIVWSYSSREPESNIVLLSPDLVINGAYGYGAYPLSSFMKLGSLEGVGSKVVIRSLEHFLATPISGLIVPSGSDDSQSPEQQIRHAFGFRSLTSIVGANSNTTLTPQIHLVSMYHAFNLYETQRKIVDLRGTTVGRIETLPDATTRLVGDIDRYDLLYPTLFENLPVREEALRVQITNATSVQGLGAFIGRILTRSGMVVTQVQSKQIDIGNCLLQTDPKFLNTQSVQLLQNYFSCSVVASPSEQGSDIEVRLGMTVAKRVIGPLDK